MPPNQEVSNLVPLISMGIYRMPWIQQWFCPWLRPNAHSCMATHQQPGACAVWLRKFMALMLFFVVTKFKFIDVFLFCSPQRIHPYFDPRAKWPFHVAFGLEIRKGNREGEGKRLHFPQPTFTSDACCRGPLTSGGAGPCLDGHI